MSNATRLTSRGGNPAAAAGWFRRAPICALWADAAEWRDADGKTYLSSAAFAAMTTDHIGPGVGGRAQLFLLPQRRLRCPHRSGNAVPPPPGSLGEIKWDGATGVYIVVDRAQDMFFVLMEDAPSGRMHVEVVLKKLIYDAFEK
jgi:CubicO group peptidase (beta-lactamase class C family)